MKTNIRKLITTLCLLTTLAAQTATGFYDPNLQRWLTPDPIGEAGGINLYQFVGNDPVNGVDPWGLFQTDFHYYAVYYLLRSKGFSGGEAHSISYASQHVDDDPKTNPMILGAWARFGSDANARLLARYHFAGSGPNKATVRDDASARDCAKAALSQWASGSQGDPAATGAALHTYADTWAHEGFTAWSNNRINRRGNWLFSPLGFVGHTNDGESPDEPFRNVSKAVNAAASIWALTPNRGESQLPFRQVLADLRKQFALSGSQAVRINAMKALIRKRFGDDVHYQP